MLLALLFCTGCGGCHREPEGYAPHLTFQPRKDWLVEKVPTDAPQEDSSEGRLDESIQEINGRGGVALNPGDIPEPLREEINTFLRRMFGTPSQPTIAGDDTTATLVAELGLSNEHLATGSRLFRKTCAECHGLNGDGRGPSGPWLSPHPRDFRQGVFKFVSTQGTTARKPSRSDLLQTIKNGLPTTPMPSFGNRSDEDRERLVDYVQFLSIRGATEYELLRRALKDKEQHEFDLPTDGPAIVKKQLVDWQKAHASPLAIPTPPPLADNEKAAAIQRGHQLFLDAKGAGCVACHNDYGRQSKYQYDVWGTLVKPRQLTENKRKASPTAEALFTRIRGGIGASHMPAAATLTDAQIWDIVHFLEALPYPDRLPADVNAKVYER